MNDVMPLRYKDQGFCDDNTLAVVHNSVTWMHVLKNIPCTREPV